MSEESGFKTYENAQPPSGQIKPQVFLVHLVARLYMLSVLLEIVVVSCKRDGISRQGNERLLQDFFE